MSRFIAVECDDDVVRLHDEETGEWSHMEFSGPNAMEIASGCVRIWNAMIEARDATMEEWFDL